MRLLEYIKELFITFDGWLSNLVEHWDDDFFRYEDDRYEVDDDYDYYD